MNPAKLDPYQYIELVRFVQADGICHGKLLIDYGKLYSKLHFSVAAITWVIYDSRKHSNTQGCDLLTPRAVLVFHEEVWVFNFTDIRYAI